MQSNPRNDTIQTLVKEGFRVQFSNDEFTLLTKPASHSTVKTAQVTPDGTVNRMSLEDFITTLIK